MVGDDRDYVSKAPDARPPEEQPRWRQDFPIDVPQDNYISRREFTKFLVLTSAAFVFGQWWIVYENWRRERRGEPPVKEVAKLSQIPVGGSLVFHYPTEHDPCILLHRDENNPVAYSQKCTHLSCAVIPEPENNRLACPCHHGYFAADDGRVLSGPPQRPLPRILLEVRGDVVYATGVELRTV